MIPSVARASLVDEVDKLTPEQAYQFEQKLGAKVLEPVPQSFFTEMTAAFGGGFGVYDPKTFNDYLSPNQAKIDTTSLLKVNLMWKLSSHFLFGLIATYEGVHQAHSPSAGVFHNLSVAAPAADIAAGFRVDLSDHFFLVPTLGIGAITAFVNEETTNDAKLTTYSLRYSGTAFHALVELPLYLRLNRIWSLGLTNAFQLGNITGMERAEDHPASVPNLSLTGYQGTLTLAFNI
jgi:hypothetical protein